MLALVRGQTQPPHEMALLERAFSFCTSTASRCVLRLLKAPGMSFIVVPALGWLHCGCPLLASAQHGAASISPVSIRQRGTMSTLLQPGMSGTLETTVTESMLASSVGSGKVCVFSTAMMVAWMEATAVDVAQAALAEGLTTVGTGISVNHVGRHSAGHEGALLRRAHGGICQRQGLELQGCRLRRGRPYWRRNTRTRGCGQGKV